MSAVLKDIPELQPMREDDLAQVMAIEKAIYSHPWTQGNFADSLRAGYECRTWRLEGELIGYFVLMVAAGEAHLLNLSIAEPRQRRGHGAAQGLLSGALRARRRAGPDARAVTRRHDVLAEMGLAPIWRLRDRPAAAEAPAAMPAGRGWIELKQAVPACIACGLHKSRTQTVFGVGDENADWMLIGEAPGA